MQTDSVFLHRHTTVTLNTNHTILKYTLVLFIACLKIYTKNRIKNTDIRKMKRMQKRKDMTHVRVNCITVNNFKDYILKALEPETCTIEY